MEVHRCLPKRVVHSRTHTTLSVAICESPRSSPGGRRACRCGETYNATSCSPRARAVCRDNADGIVVYAVHVSNTSLPPELATITTITGGESFNPGDKNGLRAVFRKIDQMQQTKLKPAYAVRQDFFWPFAISGMILLGISLATSFGLRYTPW